MNPKNIIITCSKENFSIPKRKRLSRFTCEMWSGGRWIFQCFSSYFSYDKFEYKLYFLKLLPAHMLLIDVFRNILYRFTFFFLSLGEEEKWHTCHEIYIFLRFFSSLFSFQLFGTTRQDLYRVGCMLQFNNAIYHSLYLSMKISFNRGKSHLILFFPSLFFIFPPKTQREREKIERKLDLRSLSLQGDGIWLVIAFLFHSFFPFYERFILVCCDELFHLVLRSGKLFLSRDIISQNLLSFLINIYERETISKKQDTYFAWSRSLIFNRQRERRKKMFKNNKISLYRVASEILSPQSISSSRWVCLMSVNKIHFVSSFNRQRIGDKNCIRRRLDEWWLFMTHHRLSFMVRYVLRKAANGFCLKTHFSR